MGRDSSVRIATRWAGGGKLDEAYKIKTPGNYPEESIQHTEQGESLKSRKKLDEANSRLPQFFELA